MVNLENKFKKRQSEIADDMEREQDKLHKIMTEIGSKEINLVITEAKITEKTEEINGKEAEWKWLDDAVRTLNIKLEELQRTEKSKEFDLEKKRKEITDETDKLRRLQQELERTGKDVQERNKTIATLDGRWKLLDNACNNHTQRKKRLADLADGQAQRNSEAVERQQKIEERLEKSIGVLKDISFKLDHTIVEKQRELSGKEGGGDGADAAEKKREPIGGNGREAKGTTTGAASGGECLEGSDKQIGRNIGTVNCRPRFAVGHV